MSLSAPDGRNVIFEKFTAEFPAAAATILGYTPEIRYQGSEKSEKPNYSRVWVRISTQTVEETQTTLADQNGVRRWGVAGLIFVQVFAPQSAVNGWDLGNRVADAAKKVFRGQTTPSPDAKIWFYNARVRELDSEESAYRFNVVAEYEHDEIA